jgi:hypothetical protein
MPQQCRHLIQRVIEVQHELKASAAGVSRTSDQMYTPLHCS